MVQEAWDNSCSFAGAVRTSTFWIMNFKKTFICVFNVFYVWFASSAIALSMPSIKLNPGWVLEFLSSFNDESTLDFIPFNFHNVVLILHLRGLNFFFKHFTYVNDLVSGTLQNVFIAVFEAFFLIVASFIN